jgi:predicted nucleic acid-binding Zn ribbon protein
MENNEDVKSERKCFYEECKCQIPSTERFCSDYCRDASEVEETELQCECGHPACALD